MAVVEFVWWSGTEDFLNDLDVHFKPTVDHVSAADGCLAIYTGLQEEDKTMFWMIVVWQSHEHHQAMMDRPDYAIMVGRLKPYFRDGQLKMRHVEFNGNEDGQAVFSAPTSVISFFTLKDGKTKEDLQSALKAVMGVVDWRGAYSHAVWGQTHEDTKSFILVTGCENSKASSGSSSRISAHDAESI